MYAMKATCPVAISKVTVSSRRSSLRQMRAPARRAASLVVRAEGDSTPTPPPPSGRRQRTGFVSADNSGRGNIFAIEPETVYISSPSRDAAAKQGLGGLAGIGGLLLAVVGVAAGLFIVNSTGEATIAEYSWDKEALEPLSYYLKNL